MFYVQISMTIDVYYFMLCQMMSIYLFIYQSSQSRPLSTSSRGMRVLATGAVGVAILQFYLKRRSNEKGKYVLDTGFWAGGDQYWPVSPSVIIISYNIFATADNL